MSGVSSIEQGWSSANYAPSRVEPGQFDLFLPCRGYTVMALAAMALGAVLAFAS
jgi:hypothetical protein